jgi:Recombination directionality factor-like
MSPILDLQRRLHETGRIRIGVQVPTSKGRNRPQRLTTFRLTSPDRRALERVAQLYGGKLEQWKDAPVGEQWQVITTTAEVRVAVPPERMALSQSMELWSGGGCVRRCDGERQANDEPCFCATLEADDQTPRCTRHTRLSLMLADLATTGLWRLDTQGFYASEELAGAFELAQMLSQATGRALLPGWLRLEQREIRRPGEQVKRFAVPVLDLEMDAGALLGPPVAYRRPPELTAADGGEPPPSGLTPVPAEQAPSLADELARVENPEAPKPRRNAAAPIPATGLAPRTVAQARDEAPRKASSRREAPARATPQADAPAPLSAQDTAPGPPRKATDEQRKKVFALFGERGIRDDRDERLAWINERIGREIESTSDLTFDEISRLIDKLDQEPAGSGEAQDALAPGARSGQQELDTGEDPEGDKILDVTPERVDIILHARREAGVDDDWLRDKLGQLGLEDVPDRGRIGKDVLLGLSRQQALELHRELNSIVDQRIDQDG